MTFNVVTEKIYPLIDIFYIIIILEMSYFMFFFRIHDNSQDMRQPKGFHPLVRVMSNTCLVLVKSQSCSNIVESQPPLSPPYYS